MTIIELFAGVGTQYAALRAIDSTATSVGISEIDPRPLKAYKVLNGDAHNFGDITQIDYLPYADIWTYSFPCTDISIAGQKKGLEGEHSSLLYEVYRLLQTSPHPRILLMENVSNLCSERFMPRFQEWIDALTDLGYTSFWKKIKAHTYGGGTIRDRVFMVSQKLSKSNFIFPNEIKPQTILSDYLSSPDPSYKVSNDIFADIKEPYFSGAYKLADFNKGGQGNRIYSILGQAVTLTATGGGKAGSSGGLYFRGDGIYKLTPFEMCRVMGWSEEEAQRICGVLTPREVGFCMGNAIDKKVLEKIFQAIKEQYNV